MLIAIYDARTYPQSRRRCSPHRLETLTCQSAARGRFPSACAPDAGLVARPAPPHSHTSAERLTCGSPARLPASRNSPAYQDAGRKMPLIGGVPTGSAPSPRRVAVSTLDVESQCSRSAQRPKRSSAAAPIRPRSESPSQAHRARTQPCDSSDSAAAAPASTVRALLHRPQPAIWSQGAVTMSGQRPSHAQITSPRVD